MATTDSPKTLQEAIVHFADPKVCEDALVAARWPRGVQCPHCGSLKVRRLEAQKRWECSQKHPRRQFSAKVGTIFEDSPLKLSTWFVAIWLISSAKNGISSYELHRAIGITQKSAWFVLHRIRLAMQAKSFEKKLSGEVEIDESYFGGRVTNMHHGPRRERMKRERWGGKVAVMGLLERHGPDGHSVVRTQVLRGTKRSELFGRMKEHVEPGSHVMTDALPSYASLNNVYVHQFIDHMESYAKGNVHTNGLENYWSLMKRALKGTYVSVEPFHMFRYMDEGAYRFNSRKMTDADRVAEMTERVVGRRLTYAELTGEPKEQSA